MRNDQKCQNTYFKCTRSRARLSSTTSEQRTRYTVKHAQRPQMPKYLFQMHSQSGRRSSTTSEQRTRYAGRTRNKLRACLLSCHRNLSCKITASSAHMMLCAAPKLFWCDHKKTRVGHKHGEHSKASKTHVNKYVPFCFCAAYP